MKKKIAIAGCGVIGLTTGIRLQDEGYDVCIITRDLPEQTTSNKAAAFWFPYHVRDSEKILDWSMRSYEKFELLSGNKETGVHMTPVIKLGSAVNEIEQRIKDTLPAGRFRPLKKKELRGGFESGWHIEVPLIETPVYLPFLLNTFKKNGGEIKKQVIQSLNELMNDETIVINCTGLGSRELVHDEQLIPIRGQIAFMKTENQHRIILDDSAPTYIVYRSDGCICGGTYEENCYKAEPEEKTLWQVLLRCFELEPKLKDSATLISCWAGLRPYRTDIRVEAEPGKLLIHNYGHGGSGFTVSWGCAEEVVKLLQKV